VIDAGPNWLIDQWAATPDAGPSAAMVLNATGLGAVLGVLVGALQCPALIRTPRLALLWIVLHGVLCAVALYANISDLPAYNFVGEHARDRLFGDLLVAVFLALGGSAVLGGALLAWGLTLPDPTVPTPIRDRNTVES
jgi:hypothetical protein